MSTWVAHKYDAANDPHMPKVGAPSPDGEGTITKVEVIEATKLYKMAMAGEEPDPAGNRVVLVVDHPTRPFVKYFVWVK